MTKYLQVMATAQSHTMEILTRLVAGPTLARRDAYLARSCLEDPAKASLRVQPIEAKTLFGPKFQGTVQTYKDDLAHKSLQRAASSVPGPKVAKPKPKKPTQTAAKPPSDAQATGSAPPTLSNMVIKKSFTSKKANRGTRGRKGNQK